jgi:hypothetical protein
MGLEDCRLEGKEDRMGHKTQVWMIPTVKYSLRLLTGQTFECGRRSIRYSMWTDTKFSQKNNHGALKYEIAIDIYRSRVLWI